MPRDSNPTLRVVAVLDFLAARADESFGLSDLARILQMNKATCHTVLGSLVATGYLLMDPDTKTYRLGPSSVALGSAALAGYPALEPARQAMRRLSDELGVVCMAMVNAANHLVMLGEYGTPGPLRPTLARVGLRTPFVPPLGATLIAWATPPEYEQWLRRADPPLTQRERTVQHDVVASIRARGFAITQVGAGDSLIEEALRSASGDTNQALTASAREATRRARQSPDPYVLIDIDPARSYPVGTVAAPVFGFDGRPVLSLVLEGFRWRLTGEDLWRIGRHLVDAAGELSVEIGGKAPVFQLDGRPAALAARARPPAKRTAARRVG
jgi:DNA-binding IclR family transcriptional regulator